MELPSNSAVRIVRNPHSMPHVPAGLQPLVDRNTRQESICMCQAENYARRRQRYDLLRLARIGLSHPFDSDSDDEPMVPQQAIEVRVRRRSSIIERVYQPQLPTHRDLLPRRSRQAEGIAAPPE